MAELMRLPDTELEIMKVIWENGATLSTSEIKASLEEQCFCLADLAEPFD